MVHTSLAVLLPNDPPFDWAEPDPGNWYDSFLGNVVLPVVSTGKLDRFWFSHYGGLPSTCEAKFRFTTDHFADVDPLIQDLLRKYKLKLVKEHEKTYPADFDIIGDLVKGPMGVRFFGANKRQRDREARGQIIFDMLHSVARLTLDCLSESDGDGHWYREINSDENNDHFGDTLEAAHHLFCNETSVPTGICVISESPLKLMSPMYAKSNGVFTKGKTRVDRVLY